MGEQPGLHTERPGTRSEGLRHYIEGKVGPWKCTGLGSELGEEP